jgi:rod shape-determining protein MreD
MSDSGALHLWAMRGLFLALCAGVLFVQLVPIPMTSAGFSAPDILLCLILAFASRRPEYAPILLVAVIALAADLLLSRVPGLHAALAVLMADRMARRRERTAAQGKLMEWARAAAMIGAMFVANRVVLALLFVPNTPLGPALAQTAATMLAYPVVLTFCALAFGLRRVSAAELDAGGRRA